MHNMFARLKRLNNFALEAKQVVLICLILLHCWIFASCINQKHMASEMKPGAGVFDSSILYTS